MFKQFFKRTSPVINSFNGRQISHITKRVIQNGTTVDEVISKGGRVVEHDGYIKIISDCKDVFLCPEKEAKCNFLLSGNGAAIEGNNSVSGEYDKMMIYYTKL